MNSDPKYEIGVILDQAFDEINTLLGYRYFEKSKKEEIKEELLKTMLPLVEEFVLKPRRGITIKDLEKEVPDREKCKNAAIRGIMAGHILNNYSGASFKDKYNNYIQFSGTEYCKWINETSHDEYYHSLLRITYSIRHKTELIRKISNYCKSKLLSTTQGIVSISRDLEFFERENQIDEMTIADYEQRYRLLSPIQETFLKLLYGIKYNFMRNQDDINLDKMDTFLIIKDLRDDSDFKIFTKSFPNTIYFNASKHNGISRDLNKRVVVFKANEGTAELSYEDFVKLVRDMYASIIILTRINMFIDFQISVQRS